MDNLVAQAEGGLKYRKRLGLVGAAVCDHPQIEELLARLRQMGAKLSISSLRVKPLSPTVLREMARGGARTITLAPEAGSQRLREVIRKGISEGDILEAIDRVAEQRLKQLKLYFMIGLPSETDEDIEEIVNLTLTGKDLLDRRQGGCRISLNVAPFVPKAGTPFQWLPMTSPDILNRRLSRLKNSLSPEGVMFKGGSPAWSEVQAVLARGDVKLAEVLADVEEVSLAGWRRAVEKCHLDVDFYAHQRWGTGQELPWAMLTSGSETAQLEIELKRALSET
jgi:radical SAM superfamily enzyme YgiQ (UPF0313 family)